VVSVNNERDLGDHCTNMRGGGPALVLHDLLFVFVIHSGDHAQTYCPVCAVRICIDDLTLLLYNASRMTG